MSPQLTIPERVAAHEQQLRDLEVWRNSQQSGLKGLSEKIDSLKNWMMSSLFTFALGLLWIAIKK